MSRKPQETTGESAEDPDYVNAAPCSQEEKDEPTTDHKRLSVLGPFLPVVLWLPVLVIMVLRIYVTSVMSGDITTLTAGNQDLTTQNQVLTTWVLKRMTLNQNLTTRIQDLTTQNQDLTMQNQDLTRQNQNLTTWNQNLTMQNQDLTTWVQELQMQQNNVTSNSCRAAWGVREHCYMLSERYCDAFGGSRIRWIHHLTCYTARDYDQTTWERARANCKGVASDLAVGPSEEEEKYIRRMSSGTQGYWIGLRVVDGEWKWVDGSDLNETSWIHPPAPSAGHCALSVQKENKWKSVNCGHANRWICGKKTPFF